MIILKSQTCGQKLKKICTADSSYDITYLKKIIKLVTIYQKAIFFSWTASEKKMQKEQLRALREQEKQQRQEQMRLEREMRAQQILEVGTFMATFKFASVYSSLLVMWKVKRTENQWFKSFCCLHCFTLTFYFLYNHMEIQ